MRSRILVLAAALLMAPLGASAADLVVWWEKGQAAEEDEAVREIVAAFEEGNGKEVELILGPQEELLSDLVTALEGGGRPPTLSSRSLISHTTNDGPTRVGSSTSRTRSATIPTFSSGTRSTVSR